MQNHPIKPIFIFSLPRSGSTLLQRMLCTSDKICSASETWLLLPFLYALKPEGVMSEYWHSKSFRAISDFYKGFPDQKSDYDEELRKFILNLYDKRMESGAQYFIDKTPRYHLICKEIIELFPDGKFIFLWRNPLSIVSSILTTWAKGKWKISLYNIDLFRGLSNLTETFKSYDYKSLSVNYDELLKNPDVELSRICSYLDVEYSESMTSSFAEVKFDGFMGDRKGIKKYKQINLDSLEIWQRTFHNAYRRIWAKRYLNWIGDERLSLIGYSRHELEEKLETSKEFKLHSVIHDVIREIYCYLYKIISPVMRRRKNQKGFFYD